MGRPDGMERQGQKLGVAEEGSVDCFLWQSPDLTASLIHDLRNPLAALLANLEFLREESRDDRSCLLEALDDAQSAGERIRCVLENLLNVARIKHANFTLHRREIGLAQLLQSIAEHSAEVASRRGVTLELNVPQEIPVAVDPELMSQAVTNVVASSLRYTPAGGRVELSAVVVADKAQLRVGNSGPPIEAAIRNSAAEPDRSSRISGIHGLGLYFCRLAAEAHGGRFWIGQRPQLPTVFGFDLPM